MNSDRIKNISESQTVKISAKAITMRKSGIDVINLSVGEPDFPTPQNVKDAGKKAIDNNLTKYTVNKGIIELRQAIAHKLKEENNLEYDVNNIIVSNGAKQSILMVMMSIVNKGDEVIIPAPYWVSYPEMVGLAEGKPVFINASEENGFKITPEQLKDNMSANTKALILCNPSNPTGAAYTLSELEKLAEIVEQEDIYVIADEIYEKLIYDDYRFTSFASLSENVKQKTIVINGLSKAYSMTGWRLGYAAGPADIIEGANKMQSHSTSNTSSISQYAGLEALTGPQFEVSKMRSEFEKRRNYLLYKLETIPGVSCQKPSGAFYVFPNVSSYYGKEYNGTFIRNSYGLAYYLLREAKVALVPGGAFGSDDHIRISYATSMENLEKGIARIAEALANLKTPAKVKSIKLNNTETKIKNRVPVESSITIENRNALVAEAEAQLKYDNYYEWNANINGVIIQLRTNNGHLYDFWVENWYPAQLETDLEPHGIIYAVEGAVGRESYSFYSSETKTGVLFNTDFYGSLRTLALGMVTDIGERSFDLHAIRAMTADYSGAGLALIGPKGTKKTEIFYRLLKNENVALHSTDLIFAKYGGGYAAADLPERKIYTPTNAVTEYEKLNQLFDRSKCENVVTKKEECQNQKCQSGEECLIDKGYPYCYYASKNSFAMLDPYWIGGMQKHVKRIDIKSVFILKNNPSDEMLKKLDADEAIKILEGGYSTTGGNEPFYNQHLLLNSPDRLDLQRGFYKKLFDVAKCYYINSGTGKVDEIVNKILSTVAKED
ncbi:MAG: pyridoxal phosphate-dependent aminotransferase [Calditrichia bacterium]|nr:pyridoxal phosphate-dependent aminotransferase [Calditrichia bacterium]